MGLFVSVLAAAGGLGVIYQDFNAAPSCLPPPLGTSKRHFCGAEGVFCQGAAVAPRRRFWGSEAKVLSRSVRSVFTTAVPAPFATLFFPSVHQVCARHFCTAACASHKGARAAGARHGAPGEGPGSSGAPRRAGRAVRGGAGSRSRGRGPGGEAGGRGGGGGGGETGGGGEGALPDRPEVSSELGQGVDGLVRGGMPQDHGLSLQLPRREERRTD